MKALILCYSTTGNTRLVAKRIARSFQEQGVEAEVRDPVREPRFSDLSSFDVIGFGAPTMGWKPSYGFNEILGLVPTQKRPKAAFVFCTCAGMPANTLYLMNEMVTPKNFTVIDGISVNAEDCWPVARQLGELGKGPVGQPNEDTLGRVREFANGIIRKVEAGSLAPKRFELSHTPLHYLGLGAGRDALRLAMGRKTVDEDKCQQCGTCAQVCAARAIALAPFPVFSDRCMGCWACYNNCPHEAITTTVTGSRGHYRGPALRT